MLREVYKNMHPSNDLGLISLDMCVLQKIVPNCILTLHLPQCAPQLLLSRWPSGIQWGFLYALKAQCCLCLLYTSDAADEDSSV